MIEAKEKIHKQITEMDKEILLKAIWDYTGDILLEDEDFIEFLKQGGYIK